MLSGSTGLLVLTFMCVSYTAAAVQMIPTDTEAIVGALKKSLLHLLGFKARPSPQRATKPPQLMLDMYRKRMEEQQRMSRDFIRARWTRTANTVRSFFHAYQQSGKDFEPNVVVERFFFDVTSVPKEEELTSAELRLYRINCSQCDGRQRTFVRIEVHEIMRPAQSSSDSISRLIDVRTVDASDSSWESFDVIEPVLRWMALPNLNHGIEIRSVVLHGTAADQPHPAKHHVRLRRSADDVQTWHSRRPLLVTFSDEQSHSRQKRRTRKSKRRREARRKKRRRQCRRHALYVDFSQVGWNDWIIAPPGYGAYYCHGNCGMPLVNYLNTTNHAIVQNIMNSLNPMKVPQACCVPTDLSSISMLYSDEHGRYVLKSYQDMVVEGCGCR